MGEPSDFFRECYRMFARVERLRLPLLLVVALLLPVRLAGAQSIGRVVQQTASDPRRRGARIGVHVVAAASGRVIYSHRATESFIAASNQKLIMAATALQVLGPDYEFSTGLYAAGPVRSGALHGDIILRGGGDPTIGGRYDEEDAATVFARWAGRMKSRGITRVTGDVVGDDLLFDQTYYHPNWSEQQAWKWYFPPVSALSINDNCVMVTVEPGVSAGQEAQVSLDPPVAPVKLDITCETAAQRHVIWFARRAGSRTVRVGGNVRLGSSGYSHRVTVPEPSLYAASTLAYVLQREGIRLDGTVRLAPSDERGRWRNARLLAERRTPMLPVLRTAVQRSHNHYAEQIIKTVGAESDGHGSWETGLARAAALLAEMGVQAHEFHLDDGSGLSRENLLSPATLTTLLLRMRRSPRGELFASLLARPGQPGTLHARLTDPPYRGSVRAKTGYLNGVGALSGYATARSGVEVAFSILVTDPENPPGSYSMRETVDGICRAIVDHAR